ncbi:rhodanese-like domain-containing protein [Alteribacillus iranensis]|uniref:Rhodanese-related sulfurtransferase n=1 Tax=Alteribacillus iranensis TaxID=930128 RepID=A0A1I2CWL8_9BACI|nr:rhodanese-like domain-containing protein [Alteribacillus iranensis]SFE72612.1 Rhodanese-related sulfurtransferase [Alteribacillus iranensis]
MAYEREGIEQIDKNEMQEIRDTEEPSPILIDVREPGEYIEGHIPGVPLLPMRKMPEVIEEFDKEKSYILVCRSGNRSHHTALFFKDHGIENVRNFAGGMLAWDEEVETGMENEIDDVKELYK